MERGQNEIGECCSEIGNSLETQSKQSHDTIETQAETVEVSEVNMHQQLHRGIKRDVEELHSSSSDHEDMEDTKIGLKPGKKTRGRVKIKMEYIDNKLRRYTTFSKRKTGIMKKVCVRQYIPCLSLCKYSCSSCTLHVISAQTLLKFTTPAKVSIVLYFYEFTL